MRIVRVGIDIDEVIYPGKEVLYRYLNEKFRLNLDWNNEKYDFLGLAKDLEVSREEIDRIYLEHSGSDLFYNTPPIQGALIGIERLSRREKVELLAPTSRPVYLEEATAKYFGIYFPNKFKEIPFTGNELLRRSGEIASKRQIIESRGIELMFEDQVKYAEELSSRIPVILFDKPWNEGFSRENVYRVGNWRRNDSGWKKAVEIAEEIIREKQKS